MATAVRDVKGKALADGKGLVNKVYCTLCARTVEAVVRLTTSIIGKKQLTVLPGQKCPRCSAPLDAAYVLSNLS